MSGAKVIVLTGLPGVGKTTLIKKTYEALKNQNFTDINGFYSEEVREDGRRVGFSIVTLDGQRATLATHVDYVECTEYTRCSVGKYMVFPSKFENLVMPLLQQKCKILVVDEIGKMELFCEKFQDCLSEILKDPERVILATIPMARGKPIPFVEDIKNGENVQLITVDMGNRNKLLDKVVELVKNSL